MVRKIIKIDENKCNGCGLCANACLEGAIEMIDGKAKLVRENFCDGFGDCLPACPTGAITFEKREAPAYDEMAVKAAKQQTEYSRPVSRLNRWPCQIKLLPTQAPLYDEAKLLIAADCTAYAYANMHEDFMKGKITLIGCPKLDAVDYSEKLTQIIAGNEIKGVTVVRMEVPCCGGIENAVKKALKASGKFIPWQVVTISRDGKIID
jgi:Fe-S-cluster-containing hydrogenase component 2